MSDKEVLLYAVGDIGPDREDPATLFAHVRDTIKQADVAFCQLELCLTERGERLPQVRHTARAKPSTAQALKEAGFQVVSFASNHCLDWGQHGLFDTIDNLKSAKLDVVGVGANIAEARQAVIVESKGQKIAFLAYSSILPQCYWAEANRSGCAPMRAWTHYEQVEHDQPGTPCRIHTFANRDDLNALREDVRKAKEKADVVLVSLHWGIHFTPAVIADYQPEVAYAAIDAGADVILGHHAHILKGFETYKGKPIFYSLCNFAMDLPMDEKHANSKGFKEVQKLHPEWIPDFSSSYNFPPDSRKTVMVKCLLEGGKLYSVSLLPVYVGKDSLPEILEASDPRFDEVASYLQEMTEAAGLNGAFKKNGNELTIPLT